MGIAALGAALMGAKYGFGPVPADYHAQIVEKDGAPPGTHLLLVLTALYRTLAGALFAVAILVAALALGPIRAGEVWAVLLAAVAGLCVAVPAALVPLRVERATGVGTPWKIGVLSGVLILAGLIAAFL
ncbi:hypothetical protein [Marimonas lutisalis]|uniref:hypothetical protein n=1 Tax=Marimonas lutisalis TaxID=2545756 RepID=UPI0010F802B8|nr:hypothetical protein [Marimonas lutisalis]